MLRLLREGKWSPFARTAERRLPQDYGSNPERYPGIPRPGRGGGGTIDQDALRDAAERAMFDLKDYLENTDYDRYLKFNDFNVRQNVGQMTDEELIWTANATPQQIQEKARPRYTGNRWFYH